ncbi:hypothetical protein [Flavobacterium sp.]|uniref:hypothetical protein n=1 Tax=Flavobacterium sp. TaxID=239 RepID=UPI00391B2DD7
MANKKKIIKVVKAAKTNRGVKAGVKRGPYKKKKEVNENNNTIINNDVTIDHVELPNNNSDTIDIPNSQINIIETETKETPIETKETLIEYKEPETNDENIFSSFVNENKTNEEFKEEEFKEVSVDQATNLSKPQQQQFKVMINGYMLLAFIDFIMPLAFIKIGGYLYPDIKKLKAKDIKLTQDQKDNLKEIADHMAQFVFQKMNPMTAFILMLGISYGGNIQDALAAKKESEVKDDIS